MLAGPRSSPRNLGIGVFQFWFAGVKAFHELPHIDDFRASLPRASDPPFNLMLCTVISYCCGGGGGEGNPCSSLSSLSTP
ncbi:hypothetical protein NL676_035452 [Syzygium grande]|nr:hypothetical protein NL676_035452 [Syzygium grande]